MGVDSMIVTDSADDPSGYGLPNIYVHASKSGLERQNSGRHWKKNRGPSVIPHFMFCRPVVERIFFFVTVETKKKKTKLL